MMDDRRSTTQEIVYHLSSTVTKSATSAGGVLYILFQPAALARDEFDRRVVGRVEPGSLVGIGKQRGPADNAQAKADQKRYGTNNITHRADSSVCLTKC